MDSQVEKRMAEDSEDSKTKYDFDNGPLINNGPMIEDGIFGKRSEDQISKMLKLIDEKNINTMNWHRLIIKYKDRYGKNIKYIWQVTNKQACSIIKKLESLEPKEHAAHCYNSTQMYVDVARMILANVDIVECFKNGYPKDFPDRHADYIERFLIDINYQTSIILRELHENPTDRNQYATFIAQFAKNTNLDKKSERLEKRIEELEEFLKESEERVDKLWSENYELKK